MARQGQVRTPEQGQVRVGREQAEQLGQVMRASIKTRKSPAACLDRQLIKTFVRQPYPALTFNTPLSHSGCG